MHKRHGKSLTRLQHKHSQTRNIRKEYVNTGNLIDSRREKGLVAKCIAHWSEGNWNYLIIKQDEQIDHERFRCMVYKDLDRPFQNTHSNNIINPTNNLIKLSLSDDELCRDFYANSNNFILKKKKKIVHKKSDTCSFPKMLNKKWKNLRQTKYAFHSHRDTLQIMNLNNSDQNNQYRHKSFSHEDSVFLKLDCVQALEASGVQSQDESVFLVSDFSEW